MNKELFFGLFAAFAGVCFQVVPTVFEFENFIGDEETKVEATQTSPSGLQLRRISLKPGEKKIVELPGDNKNLNAIVVMSAGFPKSTTHNERATFFISQQGTAECKRVQVPGLPEMTHCFYLRPDLLGKTNLKIMPALDNHYQVQSPD